jgi:uncharacterized protein (TIGR00299 family) protein
MALGAFVDLGIDPGDLRARLGKLGVGGWTLDFAREERNGMYGVRALVRVDGEIDPEAHEHEHGHGPHDEHHHEHEHEHGPHDEHHHGHAHSRWRDIRHLIAQSGLTDGAKQRALDIFLRVARAEAQVHGVPVDDVAFHEVGALDSIIDIAGAAICMDLLAPRRITASEVELGGGTVTCAHGTLPVPAPATALILRGIPVKTGGFHKEMTTPTGAAILAASVDEFFPPGKPSGVFVETQSGFGLGRRRLDKPNALRLSLRDAPGPEESPWRAEALTLLQANIDDMTGEALGFLMDRCFEAGALDVTFSSLVMKKSRPGVLVSVLAPPDRLAALRECLFVHSSTLGFREIPVNRLSLPRTESTVSGPFGKVTKKTARIGEGLLRSKIDYDDRANIARERGVSLDEAENIIRREGKP